MYSYVGVFATLCTFLTLVALIPFNRYSAGLVRVAQAAAKNNGGRISDLTASLVNMRTVKSMALEEFITDRIKTARKSESEGMGKVIRAEGFAAAHTELTTLVITLVCFGSYLIGGGKMDAAVLVPTMAALNVMRFPVWTLPHVFSQVSKGYNSMKRIEAYLDLQEEESEKRGGVPADGVEYAAQVAEVRRTTPVGTVTCDGCSFCWSRPPPGTMEETIPGSPRGFPVVNGLAAPPVIHNIEMHIQPGEFALIQGATGSGKSALLLSIMGELYPLPPADRIDQEGFVGFKVGGRLAYCAEIPWLRNRTVRENIRMVPDHHPETEEEKAWYKEVIHASGLRSDLDAMALGDMTVVGESGGKLSGGQRARVAIARAAYRRNDADVFVFDDILSALDVEVQKHIIREVLRGLLKGKTIIMASHLSPHTLLPDRLFTMRGSGGLKEATWTKPTEKDVELLEQSWQKASPQRSASLLGSSTRSQPEVMQRIRRSKRMKQRDEEDTHKRLLLQDSSNKIEKKLDKQQNFSLIPSREDLYILFIKFMGTRRLIMVFVTSVLLQLVRSFTDNWLGIWFSLHREVYDDKTISGTTVHMIQRGLNTMLDFIKSRQPPPPPPTSKNFFLHYFSSLDAVVVQFLVSYAAIGILAAILSYWKTRTFSLSYQRIANALQFHAVSKIFKAPVSYFDRVPSSGLLQVLSRDQDIVDRSLGESIQLIFTSGLQVFGVMCFSASQQSAFIAVIPICVLLFYNLTLRFLLTSKQVRTLEGKLGAMSMEVLKESVSGAVTVRAYGSEAIERMQEEMNDSLDKFNCVGFMGLMSDRWVGLRLEIVSLLLTSTLALLSVFAVCFPAAPVTGKKVKVDRGAVSAGAAFAGLGVVSSMTAARSLSMLCRRIGLFQTQYVSAEQLLRLYREVPQEGGEESTALTTKQVTNVLEPLDQQWSSRLFQKVSQLPPVLRVVSLSGKYQAHLPYVLTNITFNLKPGECVGLIGRSGNGKSSLFNALLQLMDVLQGSVGIPHVDPSGTLTLRAVNANALKLPHQNVRALRQNYFQLVSQEPFLLQGTVRDNLLLGIDHEAGNREEGPYSDRALWRALKRVKFDELLIQALPPPAGGPGASDDNSDAGNAGTQEKTAPPFPQR
ncbi:ABC transporter transmembrane region/ABC transporter, putative [Angomonas deanei]|uniref:ABC transporter transmembrane region/ABC transporter, putative n=1 Tax=Angomonas deanei TaxID=59799 RepID=A0A7G2CAP8_9TRYP|nr:ABC transporter transmembrane region/ABC transporter, putative [Angomonas deanei]